LNILNVLAIVLLFINIEGSFFILIKLVLKVRDFAEVALLHCLVIGFFELVLI